MKEGLDVLAIIPARGGSKGLPGKNIKLLDGRPLIHYTIEAALKSEYIQKVLVTTDDEEIASISKAAGAEIPFLRPAHLAGDDAKTIDVIKHALSFYEADSQCAIKHIILLQPTSPLRNSWDIDQAYRIYIDHNADSLQSVSPVVNHPYLLRRIVNDQLRPYKDDRDNLLRQDVESLYQLNGAIYIFKRELLNQKNTLVGDNNYPYVMPFERSIDIDDIYDFWLAERILKEQGNNEEMIANDQ